MKDMTIFVQQRLKSLREEHNLTLGKLAAILQTTPITLSRYETGKRSVSISVLAEICHFYNMTLEQFFTAPHTKCTSNLDPVGHTTIYGTITAGGLEEAIEDALGELELPNSLIERFGSQSLFALQINGESMNKIVPHGSYAVFHQQETAKNGEIVAVLVDGSEATLKRYFQLDKETVVLKPESHDPDFQALTIDLRSPYTNITILGKMVWYCSPVLN